jgi:serine/threonine-protein kinase RsbW
MRPGDGLAGRSPASLQPVSGHRAGADLAARPVAAARHRATARAMATRTRWVALPAEARAARLARQVTRDILQGWRLAGLEDAAQLIVSELVSNAVQHARDPGPDLGLRLCVAGGALRIELHDADPRPPRARAATPLAESGRGLLILDALARAWGTGTVGRGKAVWAELALSGLFPAGWPGVSLGRS